MKNFVKLNKTLVVTNVQYSLNLQQSYIKESVAKRFENISQIESDNTLLIQGYCCDLHSICDPIHKFEQLGLAIDRHSSFSVVEINIHVQAQFGEILGIALKSLEKIFINRNITFAIVPDNILDCDLVIAAEIDIDSINAAHK